MQGYHAQNPPTFWHFCFRIWIIGPSLCLPILLPKQTHFCIMRSSGHWRGRPTALSNRLSKYSFLAQYIFSKGPEKQKFMALSTSVTKGAVIFYGGGGGLPGFWAPSKRGSQFRDIHFTPYFINIFRVITPNIATEYYKSCLTCHFATHISKIHMA